MPQVEEVLIALRQALRFGSKVELLVALEAWAAKDAREGTLTRETFAKYRINAQTECHVGTAILFLEFLDAYEWRIRNRDSAAKVREACAEIITKARNRRFDRYTVQEPSVEGAVINRLSGAYALIRFETYIADVCQELIILCPPAENERARYSIQVGRNVVLRGHWHLLGSTICVNGVGYKPGHQPDLVNVSFSKSDLHDDVMVMGGVLTGLTTEKREPVMMRVIVVRIDTFSEHLRDLADSSDSRLIRDFGKLVPQKLTGVARRVLEEVENETLTEQRNKSNWPWFAQRLVSPTDQFISAIRGKPAAAKLIQPGLLKFVGARRSAGTA